MKINVIVAVLVMLLVSSRGGFAADQQSLNGEPGRVGYALGFQLGSSLRSLAAEVDVDKFIRGLKDATSDAPPLMTQQEMEVYQGKFKFDENNRLVLTSITQKPEFDAIKPPVTEGDAVVMQKDKQSDSGGVNLDFYEVKFDTLEQGGYAFYNLYTNAITPGSSQKDIDVICKALSASKFLDECRALFSARLQFLLTEEITEAQFVGASPEIKREQNLVVVTWQEHLTHKKDEKKITENRKMSIWLKQQKKKWQVTKAEVD